MLRGWGEDGEKQWRDGVRLGEMLGCRVKEIKVVPASLYFLPPSNPMPLFSLPFTEAPDYTEQFCGLSLGSSAMICLVMV